MWMGLLVQVQHFIESCLWHSCVLIVPNAIVAIRETMNFWTSTQKIPGAASIAIFIFLPFMTNFLNVRKYGEVEYWITMIKVLAILVLTLLGVILLPLGASSIPALLGTEGNNTAPCLPENKPCVDPPGFICT
jgi:amino acid permease